MKVKKARIILLVFIITILLMFVSTLLKPDEQELIKVINQHETVNKFVQERDVEYNITLLSLEELLILKNSTQYAIYSGLPDKSVYRITVLEGNKGYLAFVDVETNQIVDIMGVHNLQII